MAETVEFEETATPRVTPAAGRRFERAASIQDCDAFVAELDALL